MRTALGLPDPWNEVSEIRREVALADAQLGEDEVAVGSSGGGRQSGRV